MAARAGGRRKEVEDPTNTWNMQLMAAALRGEITEAANLLAKGANPNHTVAEPSMNGVGVTPFMAVAMRSAVAQPIGVNGNPNTVPSTAAPFAELVPVLQWLCQNGADPNASMEGGGGGTIFHHCVRTDLVDVADRLLVNRLVISKEPPPPPEAPADAEKPKGRSKAKAVVAKDEVKIADSPTKDAIPALADADVEPNAEPAVKEPAVDRDLFDLSVVDASGMTAMQLALHLNKSDIARALLKHGVPHDLQVRVDASRTQAARACVQGNAAVLESLLNLGDDPQQLDEAGLSLVHLSALNSPACLDVLLDRGVSLNLPNAAGQSALSWLVSTRPSAADAIDALVSRSVDPNVGDVHLGTTPLMHAVIGYSSDAIRKLVLDAKADINARDKSGCTALHYAAVARRRGALDQLLALDGVDVNAADATGQTPLHRACHVRGKEAFVAALITKDALDVNQTDKLGNTALHVAVARGNEAAVRALFPRVDPTGIVGPLPPGVPAPAPVAAPTGKGDGKKPPAKKGAPAAPEVVVAKLSVNAENSKGLSAVQLASQRDDTAMVATLLSIGVDARRASVHGNLIHEAVAHQQATLVKPLVDANAAKHRDDALGGINDRNAEDRAPLHIAVETGSLGVVQAVLEAGADPSAQDAHKLVAPLHIAVGLRHSAIRDALLAAKAAVCACDAHARTPLHIACAVNDGESVRVLLEHGAAASARDNVGWTPLHSACADDAVDCIDDLLRAGCDFWGRDDRQRTPLHVAVSCGAIACTEKLCDYIQAYNAEGDAALPQRHVFCVAPEVPPAAATAEASAPMAEEVEASADGDEAVAAGSSSLNGRESPAPPRPDSRQSNPSRCASRGSQKRAPSASSLNPAPTIESDGVTVAVDGAAARAHHLKKSAQDVTAADWRNALRLQDADGQYPLTLAAASGSRAVARVLVRTNAAITARSRGDGGAGLPPRPPSVSLRHPGGTAEPAN